jgi:hypothetical protein
MARYGGSDGRRGRILRNNLGNYENLSDVSMYRADYGRKFSYTACTAESLRRKIKSNRAADYDGSDRRRSRILRNLGNYENLSDISRYRADYEGTFPFASANRRLRFLSERSYRIAPKSAVSEFNKDKERK